MSTTVTAIAGLITAVAGLLAVWFRHEKTKAKGELDKYQFLFDERTEEIKRIRTDKEVAANRIDQLELEVAAQTKETVFLKTRLQLIRSSRNISKLPELLVGKDGDILTVNKRFELDVLAAVGLSAISVIGNPEGAWKNERQRKYASKMDNLAINSGQVVVNVEEYSHTLFIVARYSVEAGSETFAVNRVLLDFQTTKKAIAEWEGQQ